MRTSGIYIYHPPPSEVFLLLNYITKVQNFPDTTKHFRHFFRKKKADYFQTTDSTDGTDGTALFLLRVRTIPTPSADYLHHK